MLWRMTEDDLHERLAALERVIGRELPDAFKAGYRVDADGEVRHEHSCLSPDAIEAEWMKRAASARGRASAATDGRSPRRRRRRARPGVTERDAEEARARCRVLPTLGSIVPGSYESTVPVAVTTPSAPSRATAMVTG